LSDESVVTRENNRTDRQPVSIFLDTQWDTALWQRCLVGIFLIGLVVRLGYVLTVLQNPLGWGDEFSYDQLSQNLLHRHLYGFEPGKPTVFRAPLYPFLLTFIFGIFGHSFAIVRVIQAIASALAAVQLALIGRRLSGSPLVGLVASALFIFNPVLIFTTALLYTETLYLPLLFAIVQFWLKMVDAPKQRVRYALLSGVLFGLSHLMRPNMLLFVAPLFLWLGLNLGASFRAWQSAILLTAIVTIVSAAIVAPWTVRNYMVVHRIVPISANIGMQVRQGSSDRADGGAEDMKYLEPFPELNEADRDKAYMRIGTEWIKQHPSRFVALIPRRLGKFYSPLETSNNGQMVTKIAPVILVGYTVYYLLAIAGLYTTGSAWRRWLLVYLVIAYFSFLAAMLYGGTRYSIPIQPFIMLLASHALTILILSPLLARRDRSAG